MLVNTEIRETVIAVDLYAVSMRDSNDWDLRTLRLLNG